MTKVSRKYHVTRKGVLRHNPRKAYKQDGKSKTRYDKRLKAKIPGWRRASDGSWYFENRKNRSDRPGKLV